MNIKLIKNIFLYNSFFFLFFFFLFILFPEIDIYISEIFFLNGKFISEKYILIKDLRHLLKNLMICIPIIAIIALLKNKIHKNKQKIKVRKKYSLIGLLIGPIVGCGLIANLYFKDTWGRARPVHIHEFGGDKNFTRPFVKSDQCEKNCSWISGEASGAFSFLVGTILMKNQLYLLMNMILGFLVFFCRLTMGGHFFSDNIFAMIFMIYLAIIYKYLIIFCLKNKIIK
ncbi:MAG: phosphatase PAP2 family protein [Alphaproteobacteria bacterium]|tara:strand:+ start:328 stop:1011 length:684 start_codon:yes stop_codon:yes gene_type:complete